ncbi:NB-ARC domain-containing protein [Citrus sinensis]|uniref:NB-ARC domain-containing protein n=1 Tax=Citrus sinensis TaxID=2711 RepID=A0ACB8P357_CITSI|nr:NB-ARC domain-containing protein [Citrus sinensis]
MLRRSCEVHVTHKTTAPFRDWNIEELAPKHCLSSMYPVNLKKEDYPGYNNKRGAGLKCDEPFPLGECSTFIFGFYRARRRVMSYGGFANKRHQPLQEIPIQVQKDGTPFDSRYANAKSATGMNEFPACSKFDGSGMGYSVREYPRFDSFIHPQTSFTRNMTDHPAYKRLALMSNIQRENARSHNGRFNSSIILCERYIAEVPGFQTENARSLYPMDGSNLNESCTNLFV